MKRFSLLIIAIAVCFGLSAETRYWLMNRSVDMFGSNDYTNDNELRLQQGIAAVPEYTKSYRYSLTSNAWWTVNMNLFGYKDFSALNTGSWWLKISFRSDNTKALNVILKQTGTSRCFTIPKELCDGNWHIVSFRLSDYPNGPLTFANNESGTFFQLNSSEQKGSFLEIGYVYITDTEASTFQQSKNLGTLRIKNMPLYDETGSHLPNISAGVKERIDFYAVSLGEEMFYRQVARSGSFDGNQNYSNQLLTWKSDRSANKETYRAYKSETESYNDYSCANRNVLWGIGENVDCFVSTCAKMWGHNYLYSELQPFRGTYVNTPTGDLTAPTASASNSYDELTRKYSVTITGSDDSGDVFYYIENTTKSTKQVSMVPTFEVTGEEGDHVQCYAIDFDGNMSEPVEVVLGETPCDNCFQVTL